MRKKRSPNILLIGVDSLRADHMSGYGYARLTTPHIDRFAREGALFENTFSAHIPTTSAYGSMLTGMDVFSTQVVALRHQGPLRPEIRTLPEILRAAGYDTSCVGFSGNPSSRGFDAYSDYPAWGSWNQGRSPKAEALNQKAIPEIDRLARGKQPFFLFLRHMDPHAPYLPPAPYERMFYGGNECDPKNKTMAPVMAFKPVRDFFASWMPPGITDKDYVIAQYDGAIAYMDAAIARIEAGKRLGGYNQHKDLVPTLLDLAEVETDIAFDGRSLGPMLGGAVASHDSEFYITECTWMRKHGWRTPEWKLIVALEPDFHFKPPVELYNLVRDPLENENVAEANPDVVALLRGRMEAWINHREQETGLSNPIYHQGDWHGHKGVGPFQSSQQAYDTMHIGDPNQAAKLQAESRK